VSRDPVLGLAPCAACGRPFAFDVDRVPWAATVGGEPGPICPPCCVRFNVRRRVRGLALLDEFDTWVAAIIPPAAPAFACPRCGAVSHHPGDLAAGYCGRCHDYTGTPYAGTDDRPQF
jgi:hypothetical protein